MIQEPYLYRGKIKLASPNHKIISNELNSRSCIAVPRFLKSWPMMKFSDKDTTVLMLEESAQEKLMLVSSYLDIKNEKVVTNKLASAVDFANKNKIPILISMDSNSHSTLWGCEVNNKRGDVLEEWILEENLCVVNKGNVKTFVSSVGSSIIDVTLCSPNILSRVNRWQVNEDFQFSDHRKITFQLDFAYSRLVKSRNLKKTNWTRFHKFLKSPKVQEPLHWNQNELDSMVAKINVKINKALEEACPMKEFKISSKPVKWWTADLEQMKRIVRRHHRTYYNKKNASNHSKYKSSLKEYKNAVKAAKIESWEQFASSLQDIKSFSKVNKSLTNPKSGSVGMLTTDFGVTKNGLEVLEVLMDCHFPGSQGTDPNLTSTPNAGSIGNNFIKEAKFLSFVTREKVKEAFKSFGPFKAAGPDGFKPIILQNLNDDTIDIIVTIYKACLALGLNPKAWCQSKVIFIPKIGKDCFDSPKSFRPISLTDFMYKALERIVQWFLQESPHDIPSKQHKFQFAFAKNKSTDGALSQVVEKIEAGLLRDAYTLACFCDISGAFDSISIDSIIRGMESKGIPSFLIKWFSKCLRSRSASATINNNTITRYLTRGTAQGGVGSPQAWCIGIDDILHENNKSPITLVGFADDLAALVTGKDPNKLVEMLQPVINKIIAMGAEKGLKFNALKTQVVLYTNKKFKPTQKLIIDGTPIDYSKGATYLGMFLDEKLTFGQHINNKIRKCKNHLFALKSIIGQKWGPNPQMMRWAYTGIVRPKLTYGCHLWSHKINKTLLVKLTRLDRLACLGIAPVKKSSPTLGLGIIYNVMPLDIYVQKTALLTYSRIHSQVTCSWDGIGHRLNKIGHLKVLNKCQNNLLVPGMPRDKIIECKLWNKGFRILDFTDHKHDISEGPNRISCYTDGSKISKSTGCGFQIRRDNKPLHDSQVYLGHSSTVFQAEVVAITRAAQALMFHYRQNITIRSDSQAAILAIGKSYTNSSIVKECVEKLNELSFRNKVSLQWIKAHVGHAGNEAADKNAKAGAEQVVLGPPPFLPVPFSHEKQKIESAFKDIWLERWKEDPEFAKQTKLWFKKPTPMFVPFLKEDRYTVGKIVQFITGHCNLKKHQFRIGKVEKPNCSFCNSAWETPWHLATECPRLQGIREKLFHGPILHSFNWTPRLLLRLCKESTIWSMLEGQE